MQKIVPVIASIVALVAGSAMAAPIQVDLDSAAQFFVNPNPNYSVAVDLSGSPISYTPGDTLSIDIEFVDLDGSHGYGVGAYQYLRVFDLPQQIGQDPDPPQDINVFLSGSDVPDGLTGLSFQIEFTGVTGTINGGTTFQGAGPFCNPGVYCSSGATGADLIVGPDASFLYHDFHITFSTDANSSISPFDITALSFGGAADKIETSTVPEPTTSALLGLGLAGLGLVRRRGRNRRSKPI